MLCSVLCLCKQTRNPNFFVFEVLGTACDEERRSVAWIVLCRVLLLGNEMFLHAIPSFSVFVWPDEGVLVRELREVIRHEHHRYMEFLYQIQQTTLILKKLAKAFSNHLRSHVYQNPLQVISEASQTRYYEVY